MTGDAAADTLAAVTATVLVCDDDRALRKLVRAYLQEEGLTVLEAESGEAAIALARQQHPDLLLLDVRLPGIDGFEVLRQLTAAEISLPVILVTSINDEVDQLVAYRLGAVDFVTKPVSPKLLAAKVKAFLTRLALRDDGVHRTVVGPLVIEHDGHRVTIGDREIPLTRRELGLLEALAAHPGWVYDRDYLLSHVLGHDPLAIETRAIDQHIANLRQKLETAGAGGLVQTVRGVGYRLVAPES